MALGKLFGKRKDEPASAHEPEPEPEPEKPKLKVVIIDDDPDARDFMRMGLEVGGYDVVGEGGDGPSAIQAVKDGEPDLVLVDLHMPDIGGLELLPQLRDAHWPTKFVVVSAIGADDRSASASFVTEVPRLCAMIDAWTMAPPLMRGVRSSTMPFMIRRRTGRITTLK